MKVIRRGDTYIAPEGAVFDGNVKIDGNFVLPRDSHVWGRLIVAGKLEIGPLSTVGGDVLAQQAIIGRAVQIKGTLSTLENVTVCDRAKIGRIDAGGSVILRPGVHVGDVKSEAVIYVYGKIKSGMLTGRNVKIIAA
ncbi:MAG: polymer-forming cytoskeletal protein [Methanomicrobiales archaeon]|nr:polymer-forming cytoskeletal protein [Methanomicrobiales archaeon]